jgi:hypothetical protein
MKHKKTLDNALVPPSPGSDYLDLFHIKQSI